MDDCLVEFSQRSSVEITCKIAYLFIKNIDLAFILFFEGAPSIDGVSYAFSSGLQCLIVGLKSYLLRVDSVDFVIECNVIGVEEIDPALEVATVGNSH